MPQHCSRLSSYAICRCCCCRERMKQKVGIKITNARNGRNLITYKNFYVNCKMSRRLFYSIFYHFNLIFFTLAHCISLARGLMSLIHPKFVENVTDLKEICQLFEDERNFLSSLDEILRNTSKFDSLCL